MTTNKTSVGILSILLLLSLVANGSIWAYWKRTYDLQGLASALCLLSNKRLPNTDLVFTIEETLSKDDYSYGCYYRDVNNILTPVRTKHGNNN